MYQEQLAERKEYVYPPFCRLIKVTFKHKDFAKLKEAAQWFYQVLVQQVQVPIYGPEEPSINRIRNQYIRIIQIKIPLNHPLNQTKNSLQKTMNSFEAVPAFKSVYCSVNVDYV
jgi:primosomal protein N' (replication factor Y) (superfamily II helicase)